ncbi:MAG: stage III sporulation protein AF [Clostridiales bacterium]|nr:stage III sporulation protein AF [Clostridiales bacterium]
MMSGILSWVKQMIFLLVFLNMAQQLLPNVRYRKYFRFLCGLIFIAVLMGPVLSVFGAEDWEAALYSQILDNGDAWMDESKTEDVQVDFSEMEETQLSLYREYEERMAEDLTE